MYWPSSSSCLIEVKEGERNILVAGVSWTWTSFRLSCLFGIMEGDRAVLVPRVLRIGWHWYSSSSSSIGTMRAGPYTE